MSAVRVAVELTLEGEELDPQLVRSLVNERLLSMTGSQGPYMEEVGRAVLQARQAAVESLGHLGAPQKMVDELVGRMTRQLTEENLPPVLDVSAVSIEDSSVEAVE